MITPHKMGLYGYYTFPATPLLLWRKIQKKEPYRLIFVASLLLRCASLFGVFVRRTPPLRAAADREIAKM